MLSTTTVICMLEPLPTGPLSLQPSSPLFTFFFFLFFSGCEPAGKRALFTEVMSGLILQKTSSKLFSRY